MVAKPRQDQVVDCPPSAPHGHGNWVEAGAVRQDVAARCWRRIHPLFYCLFVVAAVIAAFVIGGVFLERRFPEKDPVYSVAVASVAGLDPARDLSAADRPTLTPVLNLTVHINNARNAFDIACIPILSAATVTYGDALLARGSVPKFCAGKMRESKRVARVWAQDVVVPRFLRDQLAGELAVGEAEMDVQVDLTGGWMLVCKAKIGGGLSRCVLV